MIYLIRFALRKIRHERESESGSREKSANNREDIGHFDARNMRTCTRFLFGCNSSMKGDLARILSDDEKEGDGMGKKDKEKHRGNGRETAGRAESSEVHVSQYLSHPKLDFRNSSR